jgi:hypothetical protein
MLKSRYIRRYVRVMGKQTQTNRRTISRNNRFYLLTYRIMTTQIEQLIEKRKIRICTEWQNAFAQEFINDLQSLQPTEEREVENKMNELDFMIWELWRLMIEIEELDFSNTPKKKWWEVKQLKDLCLRKEKKLKEIIEYKKNAT